MKPIAALLAAGLVLTGCEPNPWLRKLCDPSWHRAIEGRQVVVGEDNAKVGGCVIESTTEGITLTARSREQTFEFGQNGPSPLGSL